MRPTIGQLCIYKNKLFCVVGYKFDPNFITIQEIGGEDYETIMYIRAHPLSISYAEVNVNNLKELKDKHPEYMI
jgi:hypothetical protein